MHKVIALVVSLSVHINWEKLEPKNKDNIEGTVQEQASRK
jgi:hypothetical protein